MLFTEKSPSLEQYCCTKRLAESLFELCHTRSIAPCLRTQRAPLPLESLKNLEQAATEFPNLVQSMLSSDIPEYKTLANTTLEWRSEILAHFLSPYTNGFTERTYTKIKLLKRIGYRIPSFQKLRNRILSYNEISSPQISILLLMPHQNICTRDEKKTYLAWFFFRIFEKPLVKPPSR
ncbi:transposase [Tumebacillus flagellatus]|uniref:transposase n=1 Tax=Tumebacillus flagellatus TaxID=1157490 RepID=UPI0009DE66E7